MIITRTPMRISFTGGGTDLYDFYHIDGGAVVSMAINKYIYITLNKKFDNAIRLSYSKTEIVPEVREIQHELLRECLRMVGIKGGIEVTSIADIPSGTGLGSSSSFTVGVLNALYSYVGLRLSAEELAAKACEIEINILKHPIGKQDQYAAAYGGLNYIEFEKDDTVTCKRISLGEADQMRLERKLILLYTGITRDANNVLCEQKQNINAKYESLTFMKNQAHQMYAMLQDEGITDMFAQLLHQGWEKKRSLASSIANPVINTLYQNALAAGAKGGKLLGAGGGGFLLFYCDEEKQENVVRATGLRQTSFGLDTYGSRVIYFV